MSYNNPDPYYQPEAFDLSIIGEVDWSGGSYGFDLTVVFQDPAGNLFYGEDSGCSCPGIFEDFGLEDLTGVSFYQLNKHLNARLGELDRDPDTDEIESWHNTNAVADVAELLSKVANR